MSVNAVLLPLCLALMMLVVGSSLALKDFGPLWQKPKAALLGFAGQLLLLPLLAWALIGLFSLSGSLAIGLLLIAAAPGGATSNLFSHLARGDVALSIALTAVMSLLAPLWMPWVVQLQLGWLGSSAVLRLSWLQSTMQLVLVTAIPLILGMLWRRLAFSWVSRHERQLKIFALVVLLIMISALLVGNAPALRNGVSVQSAFLVIFLASLALLAGYLLAKAFRLNQQQARTLCFETGVQNAGIAMLVAFSQLQQPEAGMLALQYGLLMNIPALLVLWWFSQRGGYR